MSVTLVNVSRRIAVFVLPHGSYCTAAGSCSCTRRRDGALVAASLTVPAQSRVSDLPLATLEVGEITRAVRAGDLRVERPAPSHSSPERGPAGAPPPNPVEMPDERRAARVQGRRR